MRSFLAAPACRRHYKDIVKWAFLASFLFAVTMHYHYFTKITFTVSQHCNHFTEVTITVNELDRYLMVRTFDAAKRALQIVTLLERRKLVSSRSIKMVAIFQDDRNFRNKHSIFIIPSLILSVSSYTFMTMQKLSLHN